MSSIAVISWWIWSRSNGVMNVLCRSAMVSCVTLSAARSAASMRCACASSSVKLPSIAASSRLPSTMRSACALKSSKNFPSRGIRRPSMVGPFSVLEPESERFQLADLVGIESPIGEGGGAALAALGRCAPHLARRAREPRRRRRLRHVLDADKALARDVVRIPARLGPGQHRREARVRAFEHLAPLVARLGFEYGRKPGAHFGPARAVVLAEVGKPQALQQVLVEPRLDRADRDMLAVPGLVDVVPGRAGVEDVRAALF